MKPLFSLFKIAVFHVVAIAALSSYGAAGFLTEEIDSDVAIGYGVSLADINGDGKTDIVLCDKNDIYWYKSPDWKKHRIAHNLTKRDHVCVDALDLDGDGKAEIAVGAEWNPGDTLNSGSLHYLIPQEDKTKSWSPIRLPHEPTTHRVRWIKGPHNSNQLLVVPLHGRGNKGGKGVGVKIEAYSWPKRPESHWVRTLVNGDLHMTHNVDPIQMDSDPENEILICATEGVFLADWKNGRWENEQLAGKEVGHENFIGASEVRHGKLPDSKNYFVTVESFHGNNLVLYKQKADKSYGRQIIFSKMSGGHAVATGDFLNSGYDQIIFGWRNKLRNATYGIQIATLEASTGQWKFQWIDEGGLAAEDIKVADLDNDGDLDFVASGRSSNNLRIYWNELNK